MRRPPKIVGVAKSPTGVIHAATDRVRRGRLMTLCGLHIENGWGSPHRGRRLVDCRNCIQVAQQTAAVA
jgi:hypothetical protein